MFVGVSLRSKDGRLVCKRSHTTMVLHMASQSSIHVSCGYLGAQMESEAEDSIFKIIPSLSIAKPVSNQTDWPVFFLMFTYGDLIIRMYGTRESS